MAERGLAKGKTGKQLEAAAERMSNAQVSSAMFAAVKPMIELAQVNSGVLVEALDILRRATQELEDLCLNKRNAMGKRRRATRDNAPAVVSVGDTDIEVLNPVAPVSGAGRTREKTLHQHSSGGRAPGVSARRSVGQGSALVLVFFGARMTLQLWERSYCFFFSIL